MNDHFAEDEKKTPQNQSSSEASSHISNAFDDVIQEDHLLQEEAQLYA